MCVKNKRYWDGEGGGLVKNCPNIILRMKFNKLIVLIYGKLDMMSVCVWCVCISGWVGALIVHLSNQTNTNTFFLYNSAWTGLMINFRHADFLFCLLFARQTGKFIIATASRFFSSPELSIIE